jgi:hypothetical protein
MLDPVELFTPEAEEMKNDYNRRKRLRERRDKRNEKRLLYSPPIERVKGLLDSFEAGDSDAWWKLNMEMTLEPDSTHYGEELKPDLTLLPVWKVADESLQNRIIKAAQEYVLGKVLEEHQRIFDSTLYRPAFAGYRAFYLLLKVSKETILGIPVSVWKEWAPTILSYPISNGTDEETFQRHLIKIAYRNAPDEVTNSLLTIIDKENDAHDNIFIVRKVEECWDDRLASVLLKKTGDDKLKPTNLGCLLSALLEHKVVGAKEKTESFICLRQSSDQNQYHKSVIAASSLMINSEDSGWSALWKVIQQDINFGRDVITEVAHNGERSGGNVYSKLLEDQLANLYIWVENQYPHLSDPKHEDSYWMGPRDSIADFRSGILQHLKMRGTKKACEAIEKIIQSYPDYKWLKWTLIDAKNITNQQTWIPPKAKDILNMVQDRKKRLVQNEEQLLDILVESLKRLEGKLQGETPAAVFLWNEWNGNYRPKNENRLSDFIKLHLEDDLKQRGIVVNREVEIRSRIGDSGSSGERTDIQIDAFVKGQPYDVITAIIEVKGCWHTELNEAMETQLVNRYLKDNSTRCGLYLIGWFNCNQWDNEDSRRRNAPKMNIEDARKQFNNQAEQLSQKGKYVKAFVLNTALR